MPMKSSSSAPFCGIFTSQSVPDSKSIDRLLKTVTDELRDTERRLAQCFGSITSMTSDLATTSTTDAPVPNAYINNIADNAVFAKKICKLGNVDEVNKFLKSMLENLHNEDADEEAILQHMLHLQTHEGLTFPWHGADHMDPTVKSMLSLNAVPDDIAESTLSLWTQICSHIRKSVVKQLEALPLAHTRYPQPLYSIHTDKRIHCLRNLSTLYAVEEVWAKYRSIREAQLVADLPSKEAKKHASSNGVHKGEEHDFASLVHVFDQLCTKALQMMVEDYQICLSGIFGLSINPIMVVSDLYLDKIQDQLQSVVNAFRQAMESVPSKKNQTNSGALSKSQSSGAACLRGKLERKSDELHSKSFYNLAFQSSLGSFTDIHDVPTDNMGLLLQVVSNLDAIDVKLIELRDVNSWHTVASVKKQPVHRRIRSALKGSQAQRSFSDYMQPSYREMSFSPDQDLDQGLINELTRSLIVREASQDVSWDWKSVFKPAVTDISKSLETYMKNLHDEAIMIDEKRLKANGAFDMTAIAPELIGGRLDYPQKASTGVLHLFSEFDSLLSLAKLFNENSLKPVCKAFVHGVEQSAFAISRRMNQLATDVLYSRPITLWYDILATSTLIRNQLFYYATVLRDASDSQPGTFSEALHMYETFMVDLADKIKLHHLGVLQNSILFDPEGMNYAENKEFYESERTSFSVQMWNYYLRCLQHDLYTTCQPTISQDIFLTALKETLGHFSRRYSSVIPSYRRLPQLRTDLTAILLCTSELVLFGCNHTNQLLDPLPNNCRGPRKYVEDLVRWIHIECNLLLATLAVLAAPIEVLYKVYRKGFRLKRNSFRRSMELPTVGYQSQWLAWIRPGLYRLGVNSLDCMPTNNSVYLQLKILYAQPHRDLQHFLQALLMNDFHLAILLLLQTAMEMSDQTSNVEAGDGLITKADQLAAVEDVFFHMYTLLLQSDGFVSALGSVVCPVLEKMGSWDLLCQIYDIDSMDKLPPWITALLDQLQPLVNSVLVVTVKALLKRLEMSTRRRENTCLVLENLPCGCYIQHPIPATSREHTVETSDLVSLSSVYDIKITETPGLWEGFKDSGSDALHCALSQLKDSAQALPEGIITMFQSLQTQLNQKALHVPRGSIALNLIAMALLRGFSQWENMQQLLGLSLTADTKDSITLIGQSLYAILMGQNSDKSSIPRSARMFLRHNKNWLDDEVEALVDFFSDCGSSPLDVQPLHGLPVDYVENLLHSLVCHIQAHQHGSAALEKIYNLVHVNLDWILEHHNIQPTLGTFDSQKVGHFTVTTTAVPQLQFNPLNEFDLIGNCPFDHAKLSSFSFNWSALLGSDLGLSLKGFQYLLMHRHDMQADAVLSDTEEKAVQGLKKKFDPLLTHPYE